MGAENAVRIDGGVNAGAGPTVANSWNMRITDGVDISPVTTSALGNALLVTTGTQSAGTTLAAVAVNTTGTTIDFGAAKSDVTCVTVGTGTLTGTATIELSLNGTDWVSSTVTIAVTAASVLAGHSVGRPARYARATLSGQGGTGTLTATIMGA
jgi:hypothetical protein